MMLPSAKEHVQVVRLRPLLPNRGKLVSSESKTALVKANLLQQKIIKENFLYDFPGILVEDTDRITLLIFLIFIFFILYGTLY